MHRQGRKIGDKRQRALVFKEGNLGSREWNSEEGGGPGEGVD